MSLPEEFLHENQAYSNPFRSQGVKNVNIEARERISSERGSF